MNIQKQPFGVARNNTPVDLFRLTNDNSITVKITNYGGIITSIVTADSDGQPGDIVLGFDKLAATSGRIHFWGAGGAQRQPHGGWPFCAGWRRVYVGTEQRLQSPARRADWL
ncbi:MAG: hypothetical protein R3A44_22575 [Caldilineaceae bacterium]